MRDRLHFEENSFLPRCNGKTTFAIKSLKTRLADLNRDFGTMGTDLTILFVVGWKPSFFKSELKKQLSPAEFKRVTVVDTKEFNTGKILNKFYDVIFDTSIFSTPTRIEFKENK